MPQFADLAKIKNHKVEELRRELEAVRSKIAEKERSQEALRAEFAALKEPCAGTIAEFANYKTAGEIYRRDINAISREIFALHQKAFQTRFHLQKALVEYEKMRHLDREEKAANALAAKSREAKRLDEIAVNTRYILQR